MKKITLLMVLFLTLNSYSQNETQLKQINKQVWEPFTKAFETSDYNLFAYLHSKDLIRVGGDGKRILNKTDYIEGYKNRWTSTNQHRTISFRFIERISNENSASERGIYKLTLNPKTGQEQSYYGKFHVFLTKENELWKILVDYDSSEENTINSDSYNKALAIDAYSKY